MSIESLLERNATALERIAGALEARNVATTQPGAAVLVEKPAKEKKPPKAAADPAPDAARTAEPALGTPTGAAAATLTISDQEIGDVISAFARAHTVPVAREAINKFGGEGRASNIKQVDRAAAVAYFKSEHARLDALKAAAAAAAAAASPEASLI